MLSDLINHALNGSADIPCYDHEDCRIKDINLFFDGENIPYKYFTPGNDLFSHKIEIKKNENMIWFFIRYSNNIYTYLIYKKIGEQGYTHLGNTGLLKNETRFPKLLDELGFVFIPSLDLLACELGDFPLKKGLHSNSLFSVYFEDQ